ncbi:MAG: hypothetical protein LBP59_00565 [Planctomycetaceae bacterium]|nr:hypothetical protein [Planctomycetaceae bacterium]
MLQKIVRRNAGVSSACGCTQPLVMEVFYPSGTSAIRQTIFCNRNCSTCPSCLTCPSKICRYVIC